MIRWVLAQQRYNAAYLSQPGEAAMMQAGQAHWCNATHLVICQPGHPREGQFCAARICWGPRGGAGSSGAGAGRGAQGPLRVKSALSCLRDEAQKLTLAQYSEICGVPEADIVALAREFTAHGTRAAVDTHGGTMHANGFYTAYAILMLNVLIGNINLKRGMMAKPPAYPVFGRGPCYDFERFPGKVKPRGLMLSRSKAHYEQSSEYREKVAAGVSPYPYRLKAWISHMANPLYGVPGLRALLEACLRSRHSCR
ncbi:hypothetical protein O0544_20385 [Edwardsiella anguillarum]|nr:hypothetical protein [Edwardsiella anguillarum]